MRQIDLDEQGYRVGRPAAGSLQGRSVASTDPDAFLALLHRHPTAVVHLAVHAANGFADLSVRVGGLPAGTSVSALDIEDLFDPGHGTYVTVHGFAPRAPRRNEHVVCLNAVALDLDIAHNSARDLVEAEAALNDELGRGVVPEPNLLVRSGRGLWLLWLLGGAAGDATPPEATSEHARQAKAIHRALCDRLAAFLPDRAASDLARLMRLPGSYNSRARDLSFRASFVHRHGRVFTLNDLMDALDVIPTPEAVLAPAPPGRSQTPRALTPTLILKRLGRSAGALARVQRPLDVAIAVAAERGRVPEGQRHDWLFVVGHFLVRLLPNEQEQETTMAVLNDTYCDPPEGLPHIQTMLRGLRRHRDQLGPGGMLSNREVIARLHMTAEDQRRHRFAECKRRVPNARARALALRRARYENVIEGSCGVLPSARAMSMAVGYGARQVQRDYHRLGWARAKGPSTHA
jgi:hypothetical protein